MRFVELLVVSGALMLAPLVASQDGFQLSDGSNCGLEGTAKSDAGKDLNRHKNRSSLPGESDFDPEVSLAAMLAPGNDVNRFNEEKAATITAFVFDVKPGGKGETCNCGAKMPVDMDTHIELGLSENPPANQRVIVEVTPRLRSRMKDKGTDWTTPTLRHDIMGKWVEVSGWLMFDSMHIDGAENTNPGNPDNWRATCWEIHPLLSIKVLDGPPPGAAAFQPATLAALHQAHAQQVTKDPRGKAAIEKRIKLVLSKFDPIELEEKAEEQREHHHQ